MSDSPFESAFLAHFPLPFCVTALTPLESPTSSQWRYLSPFAYVSDKFGRIDIPAGFRTDFASIPHALHGIIDDDDPAILFPSGPHDWLFSNGGDTGNGRILTFSESNEVLTEAMFWCGASSELRAIVFQTVELFGKSHWQP